MVGPAVTQDVGYARLCDQTAQSHSGKGPTKGKLRFVDLDVHKESIAIAVAEESGGQAEVLATIPHDLARLVKRLRGMGPASGDRELEPGVRSRPRSSSTRK